MLDLCWCDHILVGEDALSYFWRLTLTTASCKAEGLYSQHEAGVVGCDAAVCNYCPKDRACTRLQLISLLHEDALLIRCNEHEVSRPETALCHRAQKGNHASQWQQSTFTRECVCKRGLQLTLHSVCFEKILHQNCVSFKFLGWMSSWIFKHFVE